MRLTGGRLRGREIKVPPGTRPTGARAREGLFSIWAGRLAGSRFLDLFAGAGTVGLEALSRGALEVTLVEQSRRATSVLRDNCRRLGDGGWRVITAHLPGQLRRLERLAPFDLVFADPPYDFEDFSGLLAGAARLLEADGEMALEHSTRTRPPSQADDLMATRRQKYGESSLTFYARGHNT